MLGHHPICPRARLDKVEETVTAGTGDLTYDSDVGAYTYEWTTDKAVAEQTRQLVLKLDDGNEQMANLEFD